MIKNEFYFQTNTLSGIELDNEFIIDLLAAGFNLIDIQTTWNGVYAVAAALEDGDDFSTLDKYTEHHHVFQSILLKYFEEYDNRDYSEEEQDVKDNYLKTEHSDEILEYISKFDFLKLIEDFYGEINEKKHIAKQTFYENYTLSWADIGEMIDANNLMQRFSFEFETFHKKIGSKSKSGLDRGYYKIQCKIKYNDKHIATRTSYHNVFNVASIVMCIFEEVFELNHVINDLITHEYRYNDITERYAKTIKETFGRWV